MAVFDVDPEEGAAAVANLSTVVGAAGIPSSVRATLPTATRICVRETSPLSGASMCSSTTPGSPRSSPSSTWTTTLPEWHRVIDVNLHGTIYATHAVTRCGTPGGLIVDPSSSAA